ncbi:hypothetical protein PRZ48_014001 [Zasmidium cellare]|uniref:Uncharacterized protein n=1 Tax=Zasmidium cellare TaxID=395010 RepID=A0ABR0DZS1_ZASCE|nr:hypothetical protein PRZ48_014001 [Zasmidium cellare]
MAQSKEVGALAKVLIGLKGPINEVLGDLGPFKYGTISMPYLPAVFNEELVDLAQYAGFQLATPYIQNGDRVFEAISDINYSFCGMRLGDCGMFANETVESEVGGPVDVLSVSYTLDMLTAHVSPMADGTWFYAASGIADPWLGKGAIEHYPSPEDYWTAVADGLVKAMDSYQGRGDRLGSVIVHGESATDPQFQKFLREQVANHQKSKKMPPVSMENPLYAAALGAAELGKRCMLHDDGSSQFSGCTPDLRPKLQGW